MFTDCVLCLDLRVEEELPENQEVGVDRRTRRWSHHSLAVEVSQKSVLKLIKLSSIKKNLSYFFFWSPDEDAMVENMLCFYCFFKWLSTKAF